MNTEPREEPIEDQDRPGSLFANLLESFARGAWQPRSSVAATYGRRTVYRDERNCVNCINQQPCWDPGPVNPLHPSGFRLRSSWDVRDWEPYLKSVFGGTCGSFVHNDPNQRQRFEATEAARLREKTGGEWDG